MKKSDNSKAMPPSGQLAGKYGATSTPPAPETAKCRAVAENFSLSLVLVTTMARPATYSLDTAAALAGVRPELLRHYCRLGLFGDALTSPEGEPVFDDNALFELRRFEHYRRHHGLSRQTVRHLCALWREIERLQAELRFLRRP